jgi:hypothetical protein
MASTVASQQGQMVRIDRVMSNVAVHFPSMPAIFASEIHPHTVEQQAAPHLAECTGGTRLGPHGTRSEYMAGQFHVPLDPVVCVDLVVGNPAALSVLFCLVRNELPTWDTWLLVFLSLSFFILLCLLASRCRIHGYRR